MSDKLPGIDNLLIVSHVCHFEYEGRLHAYGPYAREIDIWADLFPKVRIAAPLRRERPPADCVPFTRSNITAIPQLERGGDTLSAKIELFFSLPALVFGLCRAMWGADAIHVRCPGNLGLLGALLAPAFSRFLVAKYAGQWNGYPGESISVRLQRAILKWVWWRRGVVTVYGSWPSQPRHVAPFFTSMMTGTEVRRAAEIASRKRLEGAVEILYAGRLATAKCVDVLLRSVAQLRDGGMRLRLSIVGDGPERQRLEQLAAALSLAGHVEFAGAVPLDRMSDWYEHAQILVLPSKHSEGWPKVIAEGMCHGLFCIATDHGLLPWLLDGRGDVVPVGDVDALASSIRSIAAHPQRFREVSIAASAWARQYSLEGLRDALGKLLSEKWRVPVSVANVSPESKGIAWSRKSV